MKGADFANSGFLKALGNAFIWVLRLAWDAINSNFGTALAGAAAGAIAGAWVAQSIAARSERRKKLTLEIGNTNAATNLATGIVNSHLGLKRQFVLPMIDEWKQTSDRYAKWSADAGGITDPFLFNSQFRILSAMDTPIDHLRDILFNKVASDNFVLSVYQLFAQAIANSRDVIAQQNTMIEEFRTLGPGASAAALRLYLGLRWPDGSIDERYPNLIKALLTQTDDVILFGMELAQNLGEHAKAVAKEYGKGAPKAAIIDLTRPHNLGLLPDPKQYEDLLAALRGEGSGRPEEAAVRLRS